MPAQRAQPPTPPRFDFRTAYFAVVAAVSVLVFGFSLVSFLANIIFLSWPELLAADLELARQQWPEGETPRPSPFMFAPSYRDLVQDGLGALVMGVVFWFHGRHLLGARR